MNTRDYIKLLHNARFAIIIMTIHPLNVATLRDISNKVAFPCPLNIIRAFGSNMKDNIALGLVNEQISLSRESKKRKSADAIIVTTEYIKLKRQRTAHKLKSFELASESTLVHVEKEQECFASNFKCKLSSMMDDTSSSQLDIDSEIVSLLHMPSDQMEKVINELEIFNFGDDLIQVICQQLCDMEDVTYQNTVIFLQGTLLSKLNRLDSNPSRELTAAVLKVAESKSKAMIDGLLNPLIHSPQFGKPHLEIVNRIVKDCLNNASRLDLLKSILNQRQQNLTDILEMQAGSTWNELTIGVLQTILGFDVVLDAETVSRLVEDIGNDIDADPKSRLLPQVLITLLNRHGAQSIGSLKQITEVTNRSESFMKRAILKSIQQLEKNGM